MKLTTEMIDAAMKKAAEAGLLPRHARRDEQSMNRELIRMVLMAALEHGRDDAVVSPYFAGELVSDQSGHDAKSRELPGPGVGYALSR